MRGVIVLSLILMDLLFTHLTFQAKKLIVWLRVDEPSRNAFKAE